MAEKLLNIFVFVALATLLTTWILELIFSARWDKQYFSVGIPIFVFYVPVKGHHTNLPSNLLLESNFRSSGFVRNTSLLFKELDANTMGFRETLFQLGRWYSIMHGLLIFDDANSQVIVKGFLDWTALCFSILWILVGPLIWLLGFGSISSGEEGWLYAFLYYGLLFGNLGVFCSIDYFRFSRVAKFASQAWARKHLVDEDGV